MLIIVPFNRPKQYDYVLSLWESQTVKVPICFVARSLSVFEGCEKPEGVYWIEGQTSIGAARNAGTDFARSLEHDWVVMWDDDDYYGPGYIQQVLDNISDDVDILTSGIAFVRFDDGLYQFKAMMFASGHCTSFRVSNAQTFPEINMAEDVEWSRLMKESGAKFKQLPPWHLVYNRAGSSHAYDAGKAEFMMTFGASHFIGNAPNSFVDAPSDCSAYPTVLAKEEDLYADLFARTAAIQKLEFEALQ